MTTIDGLIVDDHIFDDPHCEPFQFVIWFIFNRKKNRYDSIWTVQYKL
jgi:hypothetical protein